MSEPVITIRNLGKRYRIGRSAGIITLREAFAGVFSGAKKPVRHIWALKDVSCEINRGEAVGIIGANGAGKTTLLKILSRITVPTQGRIELRGRVGALLEVGTGFHSELTGRENIYLNGAVLGMKKREIDKKFDEIVAFSEVGKFLDTPLKFYSSGMQVRLAFSVAARLEPEILLVDEVLAVGDISFQKKCLGAMDGVAKNGRTVLFVSHNMRAITRLCGRAFLFKNGILDAAGPAQDIVSRYISQVTGTGSCREWSPENAPGTTQIRLLSVSVRDLSGKVTDTVSTQDEFSIQVEYEAFESLPPMRIVVKITTSDGIVVFLSRDNYKNGLEDNPRARGRYSSRCIIPARMLNGGLYAVSVSAEIPFVKVLFFEENIVSFTVLRGQGAGGHYSEPWPGVICPDLQWHVLRNPS